jgi:hypothetical protein
MPEWVRYYDDLGEVSRSMVFSEFKVMGGRMVPARMVVTPADKPTESTTIIYRTIAFDIGLEPSFFSLRNLRSQRD